MTDQDWTPDHPLPLRAFTEREAQLRFIVLDTDERSMSFESAITLAREAFAAGEAVGRAARFAVPAPTTKDTARLDVLEREARESDGLHLHDGSHRGCRGLGLRDRTLRQAIDQFADFDHARQAADSAHKGETP